ncbi:hypothetical protein ACFQ45_10795 [Rhodanobacter aciditrophus]|uniref:DUF2946 domain-containing protein n=1 Tax=Rhodanobacter aciditrophus TaxID=1623218 RepID=A0ABW4B5J9_9GAMM
MSNMNNIINQFMKRTPLISIFILMLSFALLVNGAKAVEIMTASQPATVFSMGMDMSIHDKEDCCVTEAHDNDCGCSVFGAVLSLFKPPSFPRHSMAHWLPYSKPLNRIEPLERPPKQRI